jgi:hypothetical protein
MEKNLIELHFEFCDRINQKYGPQFQKEKNEKIDIALNELVQCLRELLPTKLLKRVEKDFSFEKEITDNRHFLKKLIKEGSTQSIGVTQLENIKMRESDISELNKFWKPMVNLNPKLKCFNVQLTERNVQGAKNLFRIAEQMQLKRDF